MCVCVCVNWSFASFTVHVTQAGYGADAKEAPARGNGQASAIETNLKILKKPKDKLTQAQAPKNFVLPAWPVRRAHSSLLVEPGAKESYRHGTR